MFSYFKDSPRRTTSDTVLRVKRLILLKMMMDIKEYDGYQRGFGSIIYKCFDKKSASFADKSAAGGSVKKEIEQIKKIS